MKLATNKAKTVLAITAMIATSQITSGLTGGTTSPTAGADSTAPSGSRNTQAAERKGPPPAEKVVGYFIESFDSNKDGGLSIAELTAALEAGPPPRPNAQQGGQSRGEGPKAGGQERPPPAKERPADAPAHAEVATAMVELFDTDKSGNLDKQELALAMTALAPPPPHGGEGMPAGERPS